MSAKFNKPIVKLVYIIKCEDCPVKVCEHRKPCGGIPPECELTSVPHSPIRVSYKCRACGRSFVQPAMEHPYCVYCGASKPKLH